MYDMDICMQVIEAGYKVCVCRSVLAEHCWSESKQFSKQGSDLFSYNSTVALLLDIRIKLVH